MRPILTLRLCLALLAAFAPSAAVRPSRAAPLAGVAYDPPIEELEKLSPAAAGLVTQSGKPIGVAVYDLQSNTLWSINGPELFYTYSTVKFAVMLGVLRRAQHEKRPVGEREHALIRQMISFSDNRATDELLAGTGAGELQRFLRALGLAKTTVRADLWGGSLTTPQEQARLLAMLADCSILERERCEYALAMLRSVTPEQAWGITAGAPAGAAIALKNGWFPKREGWGINTIGYVDAGRRYTIAVYSRRNPSKAAGIETVERIVSEIHTAIGALAPAKAPAAAGPARARLFRMHIPD